MRILVRAPGDDLPVTAIFDYEEIYRRLAGSRWQLVGYAYEYRDEVRAGRRAYHLHDGRFHAHCVDPAAGQRDHHYRAPEVDVFEAHDEFTRLYVAELPVRCDDLRPALAARLASVGQ